MAKRVCQIPKSRWFVDLKMARLNIWVGCGNRIIILYYICPYEEDVIFFLTFVDFSTYHLTHQINWSGNKATQPWEQKLCRSGFQSSAVAQKGFLVIHLGIWTCHCLYQHNLWPSEVHESLPRFDLNIIYFSLHNYFLLRTCSCLRSTHHWEMLRFFHMHLYI